MPVSPGFPMSSWGATDNKPASGEAHGSASKRPRTASGSSSSPTKRIRIIDTDTEVGRSPTSDPRGREALPCARLKQSGSLHRSISNGGDASEQKRDIAKEPDNPRMRGVATMGDCGHRETGPMSSVSAYGGNAARGTGAWGNGGGLDALIAGVECAQATVVGPNLREVANHPSMLQHRGPPSDAKPTRNTYQRGMGDGGRGVDFQRQEMLQQQQQQQQQHERDDARRPSLSSSHQSPPTASSGVSNALNPSVSGSVSGPSAGRCGPPGAKGAAAGGGARATGEERRGGGGGGGGGGRGGGGGGGGSRGGAADATDERVEVKGGSSVSHGKPGGGGNDHSYEQRLIRQFQQWQGNRQPPQWQQVQVQMEQPHQQQQQQAHPLRPHKEEERPSAKHEKQEQEKRLSHDQQRVHHGRERERERELQRIQQQTQSVSSSSSRTNQPQPQPQPKQDQQQPQPKQDQQQRKAEHQHQQRKQDQPQVKQDRQQQQLKQDQQQLKQEHHQQQPQHQHPHQRQHQHQQQHPHQQQHKKEQQQQQQQAQPPRSVSAHQEHHDRHHSHYQKGRASPSPSPSPSPPHHAQHQHQHQHQSQQLFRLQQPDELFSQCDRRMDPHGGVDPVHLTQASQARHLQQQQQPPKGDVKHHPPHAGGGGLQQPQAKSQQQAQRQWGDVTQGDAQQGLSQEVPQPHPGQPMPPRPPSGAIHGHPPASRTDPSSINPARKQHQHQHQRQHQQHQQPPQQAREQAQRHQECRQQQGRDECVPSTTRSEPESTQSASSVSNTLGLDGAVCYGAPPSTKGQGSPSEGAALAEMQAQLDRAMTALRKVYTKAAEEVMNNRRLINDLQYELHAAHTELFWVKTSAPSTSSTSRGPSLNESSNTGSGSGSLAALPNAPSYLASQPLPTPPGASLPYRTHQSGNGNGNGAKISNAAKMSDTTTDVRLATSVGADGRDVGGAEQSRDDNKEHREQPQKRPMKGGPGPSGSETPSSTSTNADTSVPPVSVTVPRNPGTRSASPSSVSRKAGASSSNACGLGSETAADPAVTNGYQKVVGETREGAGGEAENRGGGSGQADRGVDVDVDDAERRQSSPNHPGNGNGSSGSSAPSASAGGDAGAPSARAGDIGGLDLIMAASHKLSELEEDRKKAREFEAEARKQRERADDLAEQLVMAKEKLEEKSDLLVRREAMISRLQDELGAKTSEAIAARKETASANLTMDGMARQLAGKTAEMERQRHAYVAAIPYGAPAVAPPPPGHHQYPPQPHALVYPGAPLVPGMLPPPVQPPVHR